MKNEKDFSQVFSTLFENFGSRLKENEQRERRERRERSFEEFVKKMEEAKDDAMTKLNESTEAKKSYMSYSDIQTAIDNSSALKIAKVTKDIDTILCITRGGLVPAGMVAYNLGVKKIVTINISTYVGDSEDELSDSLVTPLSKKDIKILSKAKGVLIVDDIIDSGSTIKALDNYLISIVGKLENKNFRTFTIINKCEWLSNKVISLFDSVGDERWVIFPWDK